MSTTRQSIRALTLGALLAIPAAATPLAAACTVAIRLGETEAAFPPALLFGELPVDSTLTNLRLPLHGSLTFEPDQILFTPNDDFWQLGRDVAYYTVATPQGDTVSGRLTFCERGLVEATYRNGFDNAVDVWDVEDETLQLEGDDQRISLSAAAATDGPQGLRFEALPGDAWVRLAVAPELGTTAYGGQHGDCTRGTLDPPFPPAGRALGSDQERGWVVMEGVDVGGGVDGRDLGMVQVRMRVRQGQYQIALVCPGAQTSKPAMLSSAWSALDPGPHVLTLSWLRGEPGVGNGGVLLQVDAQEVKRLSGLANEAWTIEAWDVGVKGEEGTFQLDLDTLIQAGGAIHEVHDPLPLEGFEDGLGSWPTVTPENLSATADAALEGGYGLAVEPGLGGAADSYLLDDRPAAASWLGVRFRFDPNSAMTANWSNVMIVNGAAENGFDRHLRLKLVYLQGQYYLFAVVLQDHPAAPSVATDWVPIPDRPMTVELVWHRSLSPRPSGGLRLWIDGEERARLSQLDNHARTMGQLRIGAIAAGAAYGTLYFDDFEVWTRRPLE